MLIVPLRKLTTGEIVISRNIMVIRQVDRFIIRIILVAAMIVLYFLGKKAQKKKEEQDEQMKAAAQTVTMLIIDKKRMKMKDAGLPSQVMEQANKLMQRAKLPIVKAKVGPRVMTLIADEQIYDDIPVKKGAAIRN